MKVWPSGKQFARTIAISLGIINALVGVGETYLDLRKAKHPPENAFGISILVGAIYGVFAYGIVMLMYYIIHWIVKGFHGINNKENEEKYKNSHLVIHCPQCGRSLKGATQEMIGDIGVCPKCKAEFAIEQKA